MSDPKLSDMKAMLRAIALMQRCTSQRSLYIQACAFASVAFQVLPQLGGRRAAAEYFYSLGDQIAAGDGKGLGETLAQIQASVAKKARGAG